MFRSIAKKRLAAGLIVASAAASLLAGSANADPAQYSALVGVGSDTTQDVVGAFAGRNAIGQLSTPLQSSAATGRQQIISFDATGAGGVVGDCIIAKVGGPAFDRPNGSGNGHRALSRAIDGTGWGSAACVNTDVSGQIDYGRSSSGPTSTASAELTWIPFGRDALSFAYYRPAGSPVTSLTKTQLNSLFATGPQTIGGVRIVPCGIQQGSGTYNFWLSATSTTAAQDATGTTLCNGLVGGRVQENDAADLKAKGDTLVASPGEANTQVIVGFSAGAYIAKSNGVALPAVPANVGIGSISDADFPADGTPTNLGNPVTGTAPALTPVQAFYDNGTFGRFIYNILPTNLLTGVPNSQQDLFKGSTSKVCQATSTINTYGFLAIPTCGSTATTGSLRSGQVNA